MDLKTKRLYEFGPFRLDPEESLLLCDGRPVYLKPKIFETLLLVVENRGKVLDRETLMQRLWHDTIVEESNLTVSISQLRKALGQTENGDQFIETVPRRGYRFAARVREVITEETALVVQEYTSARIIIEEETNDQAADKNGPDADLQQPSGSPATKTAASLSIHRSITSKRLATSAGLILAVAAGALALFVFGLNRPARERFQKFTMRDLHNTGQSLRAAISPDANTLLTRR